MDLIQYLYNEESLHYKIFLFGSILSDSSI